MHCHSKYVSSCSDVGAKEIVEQYLEFGYNTVVITDHLHEGTFQHWIPDASLEERMESIGYHVVTARGDSLNIESIQNIAQ